MTDPRKTVQPALSGFDLLLRDCRKVRSLWVSAANQPRRILDRALLPACHGITEVSPVQMLPGTQKGPSMKEPASETFVLSLQLMNQLREEYGVEALVVGNAFFIQEPSHMGFLEKKVAFAHLKLVDSRTLDMIAQVMLPYSTKGRDLNEVGRNLAQGFAETAGFVPVEK